MNKISKKALILIAVLSICVNVFFAIRFYQEQNSKQNNLLNAVEQALVHIHYASSLLNDGEESDPNYETRIILAASAISKSRGWIDAHAKEMPRNLVSWIGGVEVGVSNGALGVDEKGFTDTVNDLKNFTDGYRKESKNFQIHKDPNEILDIIEDVLSSQEYMGEHHMTK